MQHVRQNHIVNEDGLTFYQRTHIGAFKVMPHPLPRAAGQLSFFYVHRLLPIYVECQIDISGDALCAFVHHA